MAQFVYDGDEAGMSAPPPPASASLASASGISQPTKPTPTTEMETDRPSESLPPPERKDSKESARDRDRDSVTIEDLNLPKSIITRLAKGVLPPNTQIQANAILAMSKSATVFINHLANAANEHTQASNKKTIMPHDVFEALEDIEFPFLRERLEAEFKKFNETQTTKRNTYRRKVAAQKKADKAAAHASGDPNASIMSTGTAASNTEADTSAAPPRSKKQKPNAADDSAMDVDGGEGDTTKEYHDASDPETEPEQENDDDDENEGAEEEEDDDDDENENEDEHDALEEREARDDDDDALDNGGESD